MSASLRKRLNCCAAAKRRDGPEADQVHRSKKRLFDQLVGPELELRRDSEADVLAVNSNLSGCCKNIS
jgi:hypothetical protein